AHVLCEGLVRDAPDSGLHDVGRRSRARGESPAAVVELHEGELSLGSREAPMLVGLAEPGVVVLSQLTKTCRDLTVGDRLHTRGASKQRVELVRGREHRATGRVTPDGR